MSLPTGVGDVIAGKYRVERVLGRGGMGVVVVARHLRLAERVAIKFPVPEICARRDIVARFVREGRATMQIRSEHVAHVYDVGLLDTGEPYLVMEYLAGRDLAAVLARDGPLPVANALEYALQATEALAEAHARGIIHRDIKPSNLFLCRAAHGSPLVKVLDFGTAKTLGGNAEVTGSAGPVGTPLFMAPEQMRVGGSVDVRADIWGLGATLHTLVAGTPPFCAGTLLDIHDHILRGAPPLRSVRPDAPQRLEAVLLKCMQKEPRDRYANVAELAEVLAALAPEHARAHAVRAARILAAASAPNEVDPAAESVDLAPSDSAAPAPATEPSATASWLRMATSVGNAIAHERRRSGGLQRGRSLALSLFLGATGTAGLLALVLRAKPSTPVVPGIASTAQRVEAASTPTLTPSPSMEPDAVSLRAAPPVTLNPQTPLSLVDAATAASRPPWRASIPRPIPSGETRPAKPARLDAGGTGTAARDPLADPD